MRDQITDGALAAASVGNKTTVAGSSLAGLGWVASSEFAAVCGVLIALLGLLINLYYKLKANARERAAEERAKELHALKMAHERAQIAHAESELRKSLNYPNPNTGD